jgi:hypothetical protein
VGYLEKGQGRRIRKGKRCLDRVVESFECRNGLRGSKKGEIVLGSRVPRVHLDVTYIVSLVRRNVFQLTAYDDTPSTLTPPSIQFSVRLSG